MQTHTEDFAKLFTGLALAVESEWAAVAESPDNFPAIATRLLKSFEYDLSQEQLDHVLQAWLAKTFPLPEQINLHNTFGEPPLTLFNNGKFLVEIYIWRGCDTSIHSHGFRGAFRVLHGRSLHESFNVNVTQVIAADVELTELGIPAMELLEPGMVRTIEPGKELTHRVIHLADPTVTLCIKTIGEKNLSQWHHFSNGLAIKKRHLNPSLLKQIYYFQYLASRDGKLAESFLSDVLARQDISTLMNLCEELASGGYQILEELVQLILESIYRCYDGSEWFRRYEEATAEHGNLIAFQHFNSSRARLIAHFINEGLNLSSVQNMLGSYTDSKDLKAELAPFIDSKRLSAFLES